MDSNFLELPVQVPVQIQETFFCFCWNVTKIQKIQKSFSSFAITFFFSLLILEEKIPVAFEKCKHCHGVASDSFFCGSQEISSSVSRTFTTAYEEGRSTEIPSVAAGVFSSELNEPVSLENLPYASYSLKYFKKYFSLK